MSSMYELTGQFLELQEMSEDENVDIQTLTDTLDAIEAEIEEKAENYGKIISEITGEIKNLKAEEERLANKRRVLKNKIAALKTHLEHSMIAMDKKKIKTTLFNFSVQKNPPSVNILKEDEVPMQFFIPRPAKIDKKSALDYLKEHGNQTWGEMKQTESLRIK